VITSADPANQESLSPIPSVRSALPQVTTRANGSRAMWRWAFAAGLGSATYLNLGLFLSFAEVLMLMTGGIILAKRSGYLARPAFAALLPMLLLLFMAVPISEFANRSESWQYLRGIPRAYSFLFSFVVLLVVFLNDRKCIPPYLAGLSLSQLIGMFYFKNGFLVWQEENRGGGAGTDWKTGYNYPFNTLVLLFALTQYKRRPLFTICGLLSAAALNLIMGARSPGLCMAIGASLATVQYLRSTKIHTRLPRRVAIAGFLIGSIAVAGAGAAAVYRYAALAGWMSEEQRDKFLSESQSKYGMIGAARGSVLATALAIYDKPILGHGSWALDTGNYTQRADEILERKRVGNRRSGRISFHSLLLGDWMQWGLAFGVFWAWMLLRCMKFLVFGIQSAGADTAFLGVLVPLLSWDILFSPVGNRTATAAFTAIMFIAPYLQHASVPLRQRLTLRHTPPVR
jgi:hypothetical protein